MHRIHFAVVDEITANSIVLESNEGKSSLCCIGEVIEVLASLLLEPVHDVGLKLRLKMNF